MKKAISNFAAIININNVDIRLLDDTVHEIDAFYLNQIDEEEVLNELAKFADFEDEDVDYVSHLFSIIANLEESTDEIKALNYEGGNIFFTISIFDDKEKNQRLIVNDMKFFRNYSDMQDYAGTLLFDAAGGMHCNN